ncbi:MAG: hypothetical protein QOE05_2427 [Actinomycetota bacterium]|nr:hypothetical protein [Actinomycetota bacterium]
MRRLALAALLLLATACAGPARPVEIGFKEVPSDVILGAHATPSASPGATALAPSQGPLAPPPPAVVALPPPPFDDTPVAQPPVAPEVACPTADPLQAPAREAPSSVARPPATASYVFRDVGTYATSGADARRGSFPSTSVRRVGNVARPSTSSFTFDVAESLGTVTTTTTYDVVTASLVPAALSPGLYLKQVKSVSGTSTSTFTPSPELELAAFPLVRGQAVSSSGVDPQTATSMQFTSTVTGKTRVDACGATLDSWVLDLSGGRLLSPTLNLDFTASYAVGTQYGGVFLRERSAFRGTDANGGVDRSLTATITTEPKLP